MKLAKILTLTILCACILYAAGCRKKPEPAVTAQAENVSVQTEQTICPVLGEPVNKNIYSEYQGKRVYFCCPPCKDTFNKEPEKYLAKLPQFKK